MTVHALTGAPILSGGQWLEQHALIMSPEGLITDIVPAQTVPVGVATDRVDGGYLVAGFVDTQVNGGGGVLFNDAPSVDGIAAIAAAHRRYGTTALLPTLISDDADVIRRAIAAVDAAIAAGVPGIIGIHIEGPFLNAGKRGIHNAAKLRNLDESAFGMLSALRNGMTLVTLAPECAAPGTISGLVARGIIISAGHTLASFEEMSAAVDGGLRGVTHLYNAMTQMNSRAPGVVGAAFDYRLYCGLIVDGHHVHPATMRAAHQMLGAKRLMLVTDAMPTVGAVHRSFMLYGQEISEADGALRGADGTLAGTTLDMATALRNAMAMMHVDLAAAATMASATPAAFLGLSDQLGDLRPGLRADIVHLSAEQQVQAVWIGGARQ